MRGGNVLGTDTSKLADGAFESFKETTTTLVLSSLTTRPSYTALTVAQLVSGFLMRIVPMIYKLSKRAAENCTDIDTCRTVYDIVWSALAIIFSCVWVSMHPNVPVQPNEPQWKYKLRQVELMMLALVAPELVVARAYAELINARELADSERHSFARTFHKI